MGVSGKPGTVQVSTQPGCAWTATADANWILLTGDVSGVGTGGVSYELSPMPYPADFPLRQGRILIRWNTPTLGQNVQITQSAGPCHASLNPAGPTSPLTFGGPGGGGQLSVFTRDGFDAWLISSAPDWIRFTRPILGVLAASDDTAYFVVNPNPIAQSRDDNIVFCDGRSLTVHQAGRSSRAGRFVPGDFDDDGIADLVVWRPTTGEWLIRYSSDNYSYASWKSFQWGLPGDVPIATDFDGDARTDLTVYRPTNVNPGGCPQCWFTRYSSNDYSYSTWTKTSNLPAGIPVPADFNADGKTDLAVFQPNGQWNIAFTNVGDVTSPRTLSVAWGLPGDIPLPEDFDGDGRPDLVVYRPNEGVWYVLFSSTSYRTWTSYQWGLPGDLPMRADFDGDGRPDLVVYRPNEGMWYVLSSSTGYRTWTSYQWGVPGDIAIASDFDGDGRTDLTVWRPTTGEWFIRYSSDNYSYANWKSFQWGLPGDIPLGSALNGHD
jgi:hypothetical protein